MRRSWEISLSLSLSLSLFLYICGHIQVYTYTYTYTCTYAYMEPLQISKFLGVVEGEVQGFRLSSSLGSRCLLIPCMLRLLPCIRLPQFMYQATLPCVLYLSYFADSGESSPQLDPTGRLDPIGWNILLIPLSTAQVHGVVHGGPSSELPNDVLHGVLNGEVHEERCMGCMLWWMGKRCMA